MVRPKKTIELSEALKLNFKKHKTCVFGIQESGKSYFVKSIYTQFKSPVVFQVNEDDGWERLKGIAVYKIDREKFGKIKDYLKVELQTFVKMVHYMASNGTIDAIIFDEADLFFRGNYDLDDLMTDLVTNHRHMGKSKDPEKNGVALIFATRRPQDIPTKVVEQSRHNIIFKLEGANALKRFQEIHKDLPKMIRELNYRKHEFIYKELGEEPRMMKKV